MSLIHDPKQQLEAAAVSGRVQLAVEAAAPRGTQYVIVLMTPSFGTHASNVDKRAQLEMLQGIVGELQRDVMGAGFSPSPR